MQLIDNFIDNKILPFTFKVSEQPMLYRELLLANKLFDDGMKLEGKIPGMRIRVGRAVLVFALLFHIFLVFPAMVLFHTPMANMDCHVAIIVSVLSTGFFFSIYFVFKEWLIDRMAKTRIKKAWKNHFLHFDYDTHHKEVTAIYSKAVEDEVPHKELQLHILNKLIAE
ncbi:MAG: hypothetical protein U9Q62_05340 [Campylobacterota bacterium]|nr:hypothetical protein [Campylobacterota bacterium]